jgi:hypothetical protein
MRKEMNVRRDCILLLNVFALPHDMKLCINGTAQHDNNSNHPDYSNARDA